MTARIAVLVSGNGSNLQAILDACETGKIPGKVIAVVSDQREALALTRAREAQVPIVVVHARPGTTGVALKLADRRAWDTTLADIVESADPDWIVLAGFMRVLTSSFLDRFQDKVINLHPALPGEFAGTRAIERAHAEFVAGLRTKTGVMVHLVPDEGIDDGPVLGIQEILIEPGESLERLTARVREVEHEVLVDTLSNLVRRSYVD
jgi:phosphoribosylglycinamide formyltransferase 1